MTIWGPITAVIMLASIGFWVGLGLAAARVFGIG